MKRLVLYFLIISIPNLLLGQAPLPVWKKCYGGTGAEEASAFVRTSDGYVIAGYNSSNDGDVTGNHNGTVYKADYWIVKIDTLGVLQWQRSLGGNHNDYPRMIRQTNDRGFIVVGASLSNDGDVANHHGVVASSDCWVVKLDSVGSILWERSYGGTSDDDGYSIVQTGDGGYVFAGLTLSSDGDVVGSHPQGGWMVKLNNAGVIQWQRFFGNGYINSLELTSDKGYVLSTDSANRGMLMKVDSVGNLVWKRTNFPTIYNAVKGARETFDKGFIMCTRLTLGGSGQTSLFRVMKTDSLGTVQWEHVIPTTIPFPHDQALWVEQTADTGYIATGYLNDYPADLKIIKIRSNGGSDWDLTLGGSQREFGYCIKETADHGYLVAGYTESNDGDVAGNHGYKDFWVVKLGSSVSINASTPDPLPDVYPNPSNGIIFLKGLQNPEYFLRDVFGRYINIPSQVRNDEIELDLGNCSPGIYSISIKTPEGTLTRKIIKQ